MSKPLILDTDGVLAQLANGELINAGGTSNSTFTVGGKGLLFDDGTSSKDGGTSINLQTVYDHSPVDDGQAVLTLTPGKDLVIRDPDDGTFLSISGDTGEVTVNGSLRVEGGMTVIETTTVSSDHMLIEPLSGTTIPLAIYPKAGFSALVDLVSVRATNDGSPVFRISATGNLIATQNLTVGGNISATGTVSGSNITTLQNTVDNHIAGTDDQHNADAVTITPIAALPDSTNVQEALEAISANISPIIGNAQGVWHEQETAATTWNIAHPETAESTRIIVTCYDDSATPQQIMPDRVAPLNSTIVQVFFAAPQAGFAAVLVF